ncbi:phage tail protein I [Orbus mooreae]|uniref:phage tail protein I n=1 Tax=Orbus mooreae TaxID=3074107 RepID=UPI00370D7DA8
MKNRPLFDLPFNDMLPSSINQDVSIVQITEPLQKQISLYESELNKISIWEQLDSIEEPFLSTLAWQLSLDHEYIWQLAESLTAKRNLIKIAIDLHRYKGSVWAVRNIIRALGFGEVDIIEGLGIRYRDGSFERTGIKTHSGHKKGWPFYTIIFYEPITNDIAELLRKAIPEYAPSRSVLYRINFKNAKMRRNGSYYHNGLYNRGEA